MAYMYKPSSQGYRHLSGFACCIGVPEQALGWFPLARFGIGCGR